MNPRYLILEMLFPLGKPDAISLRQAERGFSEAAERLSVGVVLPRNFPFPNLPQKFGMAIATPVPLFRRLAGPVCFFAADQMGIAKKELRVALVGRHFTHVMSAAAQFIAARTRTLTVEAGSDTAAACYGLRAVTGLPVSRQKVSPADIYVFFDVPPLAVSVPETALCLNFSGGHPAILGGITADSILLDPPRTLWRDWPNSCDTASLLSALCAQGSVMPGDMSIRGICKGTQPLSLFDRRGAMSSSS